LPFRELTLFQYGVVPYKWQINETNRNSTIVTDYFDRTLMGDKSDIGSKRGKQAVAAFMSFSSLGNIIVQTFTAARGKLADTRCIHLILIICSETRAGQRRHPAMVEIFRAQPLVALEVLANYHKT
jgi:hypothetical protein